jgi:hypothetical protein
MTAQPLPALASGDPSAWDQAVYAFLVEKGNRSGSRRTVESYSRMLWPFFAERSLTPDRVKPADVLAWVHHAPPAPSLQRRPRQAGPGLFLPARLV